MKIVVIGGTGRVGSKLVELLREHGHEAVAAAPNTGVNTITGEGLADALQGRPSSSTSRTRRRSTTPQCSTSSRPRRATCSPPRRTPASGITSRCRSSAPTAPRQRLSACQGRPGAADHRIVGPVLDRAGDAVLRVRRQHRRRGHRRRHRPRVADADPADGRRRRRPGGRQGRRRRAAQRHGRDRRSGGVPPRRARPPRPGRPAGSASGRRRPPRQYFGTELAERSLVPDPGAQLGTIRFEEWLSESVTAA